MSRRVDVLLVEDNEDHVFLTRKAMSVANGDVFDLYIASDGEEALDFVYRRGRFPDAPRPDLILLDINLPKKDGFQVLQELKGNPEYRTIPITMLTSSDACNDVSRCYELGGNAYVAKPTSFEEFAEKLKGIPVFWSHVAALPPRQYGQQ